MIGRLEVPSLSVIRLAMGRITIRELMFIRRHLDASCRMLEWGAGASTVYLSRYVAEYFSVECDPVWHGRVARALVRAHRGNVATELVSPPLPANRRSLRLGGERRRVFADYIAVARRLGRSFDRVLINGEARPECALEILPCLHAESLVFIRGFARRGPAAYARLVRDHYDFQGALLDTIILRRKRSALSTQ